MGRHALVQRWSHMPQQDDPVTPSSARRFLLAVLLGALAALCIVVLRPFIVPVLWAAILAYASWPFYRRVLAIARGRPTPAALAMTLLVALILIVPLLVLALLLQNEIAAAYQAMLAYRADGTGPPPILRAIPWFGDALQQALDRYAADPQLVRQLIVDWARHSRAELLGVMGSVGRNVAKLFIALFTVFFFYRDGAQLVRQGAQVTRRFFSDRLDRYFRAAGAMARAVVYGLLVTALVQGTIAGVGYTVVGVDAPVLLGALTALASVVPIVGTFLVWGPVAAALLLTGHPWPGVALLAWGTLLVHPADNLIRPLLISNATQMPFLLVMFGVIGGLAAFGLVGLFVGPVSLAIATAVWREWSGERAATQRRGEGQRAADPDLGPRAPPDV
jgi:predicted PurR-regulated permease PerM